TGTGSARSTVRRCYAARSAAAPPTPARCTRSRSRRPAGVAGGDQLTLLPGEAIQGLVDPVAQAAVAVHHVPDGVDRERLGAEPQPGRDLVERLRIGQGDGGGHESL